MRLELLYKQEMLEKHTPPYKIQKGYKYAMKFPIGGSTY